MERRKKDKRHKIKAPRVPIKTYKWEDIRRARLKGGYPWTYLYKEPFNEEDDTEIFTMESLSKSKDTLSVGRSSTRLEIKEVTNGTEDNLTPEPSGYIVITEVPSDSENHSKEVPGTSVTIEDLGESENLNLESAESSDNISQYLDKEEPIAESLQPEKAEEVKHENGRQERAKSEEPKRKRKLSIDSSYSRKSLSKLAIIKKLKEAKDKIKVPKLSLPKLPSLPDLSHIKNPLKQQSSSKDKEESKTDPTEPKKTTSKPNPNAKPVYIHIPLKPPEGETDEFSYLEFGEKKPEEPQKIEEPPKPSEVMPTIEVSEAFDDQRRFSGDPDDIVAFEILKTQSIDLDDETSNGLQGDGDYLIIQQDDDAKSETRSMIIIMPSDEPALSRQGSRKQTPTRENSKKQKPPSRQGSTKQTPSRQGSRKVRAKSAEPERKRKLSADSSYSRRSLSKLGILKRLKDAKDKIKSSFTKTDSKKATNQETKEEAGVSEEVKTEEKKASSKEPKYIHIPLKPPPGETDEFSHLEFEEKQQDPEPSNKETINKEEQSSVESPGSPKNEAVQFIFLTPPSDDEVLDKPDIPETPSSDDKNFFSGRIHELKEIAKDAVDKESPEPRRKLQPVAEEDSSEPKTQEIDDSKKQETATETTKIETEKVETVEQQVEPEQPKTQQDDNKKETTKKGKKKKSKSKTDEKKEKLDPKDENQKEETIKPKDSKEKESKEEEKQEVPIQTERMVVDEEDGLKLTESAMAKQEQNIKAKEVVEPSQELKSSLKTDDSPIMKKKVSFKRRSKDSKDDDYEDIQVPADENTAQKSRAADENKSKPAVMGNSQSMSVDEEKSYLDEDKIIKSTSLEEDYNRWSKLSDHDYEPVNPPPDNVSPLPLLQSAAPQPTPVQSPPSVHTIDTDRGLPQKTISLASSTTSLERRMLGAEGEASPEEPFTAHEMQTEIENKYFNKPEQSEPKPATVHTITTITKETKHETKKPEGPGRFQKVINIQKDKIKTQTDKFKSKLHEIKKPNIKLPSRPQIKKPNLEKFKFEKPKFNLPKIPDTTKINLPTFSLPRRSPLKRSLKQRQLSTESNAGGSKKNYFDFRTYPRLFKKKPKDDLDSFSSKSEREVPEFATVPRTKRNKVEDDRWGGRDSIRIPLHPEDSIESEEREDSVERRIASHMRYEQDIDTDDAYERENQEIHTASPFSHGYNSRWNHGSFHPDPNRELQEDSRNRQVTDLDSPEDGSGRQESFEINTSKDIHSSESSLGIHRRGVLEEIDSDEFFLRQKGISQDNIEVGMYLSSEIREAFKSPTNALADLQREQPDYTYDDRASNQSLPETPTKRKVVKKPKRKKTPHVSHEQISFDQDSELDNELPPSRPKRRSKRNKKQKDPENIIPYQETIAVDVPDVTVGILQATDEHEQYMYENEQMQGKEQPDIKISDPYSQYEEKYDSDEEVFKEDIVFKDEEIKPSAPPRKQRSLRSLNYSEHDSILGDSNLDREPLENIEVYKTEHEYIIPTPEIPEIPPVKPARTLSRSSSKSRENEEFHKEIEAPIVPIRTRSRSRTRSRAESLTIEEPCIEETCVQDFRDSMGYAVIDKHARREPPLPPPRTPPRRKRSVQSSSEQKFFTVPRSLNDEPPIRPVRNYSTLGPSRPPRKKQPINMTDEEKENIDITQYIEIDEEPNRDLISGEIIQKMRDRPLPAPPRPPRKARPLHDITSEENIPENIDDEEEKHEPVEEAEVSTQTEPLPEDLESEEILEEIADTTTAPIESLATEGSEAVVVEKRLITPTHYTYEQETITHGSLVIEPLDGARILPDSQLTRRESPVERVVPVFKEYEDETSEIPEEFTKLKDPEPATSTVSEKRDPAVAGSTPSQPSVIERIIERPVVIQPDSTSEVEVLKAQKLQVSDLDVDRLSVNELLASRIIVSEIESGNIQANEISSRSGALKVGEIELPPGIVQQLFEKLQSVAQEHRSSEPTESRPVADTSKKDESDESGQKKTPFEEVPIETLPPQRPPRKSEEFAIAPLDDITDEPPEVDIERIRTDSLEVSEVEEIREIQETVSPPEPPIRTESSKIQQSEATEEQQEEIPQRPPRHVDKSKVEESSVQQQEEKTFIPEEEIELEAKDFLSEEKQKEEPPSGIRQDSLRLTEPEVDDEPPPRPPDPQIDYIPSQPPPSFYALRAQQYVENLEGDIPMAPRRRRHHKPPISRSSSDDSPAPPPSRRRYRSPEPSIPELTGQLIQACGSAANTSIKRLIAYLTNNVLRNSDGQQDLHVIICILLVLIAGLILLGYGDGKTVHYHHWEYFNPPRDM